jgi:hypothetical protein
MDIRDEAEEMIKALDVAIAALQAADEAMLAMIAKWRAKGPPCDNATGLKAKGK